ncbi:uncharacterized protein [Mytilus edulis]|uniref:uncharacterized protein n=1 Tax=Mytilus edulis TaxID=6550 RepID=UPI0039EEDEFB
MADDTGLIPIQQSIPSDLQDKVTAISDICSKTAGLPDALDDNKKRWLVVGICLHSVISPTLRTFITPVLDTLYNSLVVSDNIDKQTYSTHLKKYIPTKTNLNYEAINTNSTKLVRNVKQYMQYDYRVYNAVDLSKLFVQTFMAHYTAIDDSCDSSALLGIIINILPSLQSTAKKVRSFIRNPWAHCDFTEWNPMKFSDCFKLMEQIIKDLKLNATDEVSILKDLSKWENCGISLLSGTPLGLELVNEIREQTRDLAEYAQTVASSADDNFEKIRKELVEITKTFDDRISFIEKELKMKIEDDKMMQDRLLCQEEQITFLGNELQRHDQETIPKHKRAQHGDNIKQWKEDDKKFFVTRATEHVISKICSSNIAVVTGSSGSGKSSLIHHIALYLHSKYEYEIVHSSFVTAPADIINYRNEKRNQVFVIDDICGKKNINLQIVQTWSDLAGPVEEIFKDNVIESQNTTVRTDKTKLAKLLVSCRLEVFKDKWFQQLCCFIKHECNILSDSLCLLPEERLLMIKQYLPNDRIKEVNDILNEFNFFPLLCRLSTDRSSKELRTLFLAPIATIRADLEEIILTENKFKQCALVLCLIFEEGFDEQWLKFKLVSNDIQTKIKRIGEEFDINLDVEILRRSLIDAFCSLTGTYLRNRGTSYEFYHDKIYDTAVIVFGQYFKECFIKYASVSFIGDRYILESVGATNNDSLVIISEDMEESYFCRLLGDLEKKNVNSTLHNKQLVYESFRMKLIKFFEINIDVTTTIFNQLDESGIITSIGYEDDDDDYDDFCIGMNKETQISTSLIESIREGYEDIIEFLIKIGCNVNLFDSNDRSPLYIACELGFTNVVILLINHNCIVSAHGLIDYFPLNIACANGYTEIVKLLIANEIDVSKISFFNGTPLINACKGGHLNIVRLLLQKDADVDECEYFDDDCTPLDVACGGGYTDIAQLLLEEKKSDINHNDGAPLFLSCQNGHTDTVKLLLVNNANITPSSFAVACENGYITIVNSLLQNETTISLYVDKLSPLHLASGNGHLNVVETLLNSQINISHFDKWSSLCVASHVGHIDIVKVLVKSETNAAFCDKNGYSPLYAACQGGNIDIVQFLIQQNITIFHFNKRGQSLLHAACSNIETKDDHLSVINLLLDKKLEISLTDNSGVTNQEKSLS